MVRYTKVYGSRGPFTLHFEHNDDTLSDERFACTNFGTTTKHVDFVGGTSVYELTSSYLSEPAVPTTTEELLTKLKGYMT